MAKSGGDRLRCPCGQPLHYRDPSERAYMLRQVRRLGPTMAVRTTDGTWLVSRHYLALHGIRPWELPTLAAQYGWKRRASHAARRH